MLHRFFILLGIMLFTFSCVKEEEKECNGICTNEFRSISVKITDKEENPVILDSISITNITHNRKIDLNSTENAESGLYHIFNDNFVSEYKNEEINLLFKGFQEENIIVEQEYKVGADCCHVYYISGDLEIELD